MDDFNSSLFNYSSDERFEKRSEEFRQRRDIVFNQVLQSLNQPSQIPRRRPRRKRRYIERNREDGHERLYNDYFAANPVYTNEMFRRRFRMRRHLFLRVVNGVQAASDYFVDGPDATGRDSFTSLQKCTMAIRMLAYGDSADRIDEYLRVGESTARECFEYFTNAVISHFRNEYLRIPTVEDTQRLLQIGASRGFPGMLGSIDCMHWKWKNCPNAWKGQFQGRNSSPTVILEAVASQDLWIWHSYFGTPGSANDLNVLNRSPVFDALLNGYVPNVNYMVNGNQYDCGYYLTDGIYPKWATFIQSIRHPQTPKDRLFATKQESVRKDVERAFGVLQARFAVIRNPVALLEQRISS
ncbi:uncharacterized protein LOC141600689 [Silene latifolia]|uniref:uncharacterized protein LOC141600689 n=1 Tax=Silene latifolia TaxID=37657 RepID=UPI003D786D8B